VRRHLSKSLTWILLALIVSQIAFIGLVYPNTPVEIGKTVQKAPFESNPTSHDIDVLTVTTPADSYDRQLDTWAQFRYTGVTGSFELKSFNTTGHQFDTIGWVDIKISYKAGASVDDQYRINYTVGTTTQWFVLQDWVNGSDAQFRPVTGTQAHRDWSMRAEPIDGVWTWADIGNLRIMFETRQVDTADAAQYVTVYEVWLSVYQSPKPPDGVSVQPASIVETLNPGSIFFVDLYAVGVTNLWGFEFKLDYDTNVLTALDISLGHEYFGYHPLNDKLTGEIRDDLGYVSLVFHSYFGDPVGFTGNTSMVRLYFSVDAKGESALHFSKAVLSDTSGKQISKPVADGLFRNVDPGSIPHAVFTYDPDNPLQGQLITFNATDSTPDGGSITKYRWGFSDEIYLLPDGNGTYTAWTGYARDWDDPLDVLYDADATFVSASADNLNESSTLTNLPSVVHDHTITKVRLTVVAKTTVTSDEKMRLMLVIGGKGYHGSAYDLSTDYMKYTSDWATNPAGGSWTWAAIDALEAGVRSVQVVTWTGELRITQLYISVFTFLEVTGSPPNPITTYFYAMRGSYAVTLGVFDDEGAVDTASAVVTVRGHDVATTSVGQCGYKLLTPTSDSLTYPYWGGSYTDWDDWPSNDGDTTYVYSQPNVVLRPNGNGSKTDWTWANITVDGDGTYTAWGNSSGFWDEWPTPDNDATYVSATAGGLNETSSLTDPPAGYRSYTITKVRVNVVARNNLTGSDEKLRPMLVVGGKPYGGTLSVAVKTNYLTYTSEWATNPATGLAWGTNWAAIDALEAGVSSVLTGSWTGELRVTQLYVSISTWGDYTAWDEWVNPDEDASYVSITANYKDETSTLEDHTSQDWAIQRVRVNFRARNALATSDERLKPLLIKGVTIKTTTETFQPVGSYVDYAYDWELSPFTTDAWTWDEIDQLEIGVRSQVTGDWTGEIRVTQLYLTVMADTETSELTDPTTEAWDIQTVRVTAVVRNTTADSNEQFYIAIVAGGELYLSDPISPNGTYVAYSWQWDKNPNLVTEWMWYDITWLEAGVKSRQIGRDWTGVIRVTQLYVEVFGYAPPSGNLLEVTPGETIRFTVGVQNHGSFNEPNVSSKLYCDNTQIGVQTLSLDIGVTKAFVYVWTVAEVYNGTYWLSINTTVANEYHVVDDSVTDGKVKVRDYHDVAVTSVTTSAIRAYRGFNRTVTMTVKNWGSYTETGFTVTFKCNSTVIETKTIASLASKASVVLTFKWNTSFPSVLPYGYYVISGTASSVPDEITLPNNYKAAPSMVMVTVAGDADGDKKVNIFDILEVQDHWYPGPPLGPGGYDINVDIDNDNKINIFDILIVQANWDKHW